MSADKIMRCVASLSDAIRNIDQECDLSNLLKRPLGEVVEKILAPNDVLFYRSYDLKPFRRQTEADIAADMAEEEHRRDKERRVEKEEPESFGFHIVCRPKTANKPKLHWTGTAFLRQSSESMRFGSFDKAEEIIQRLHKEKGARLPDPKNYHSPSVEAITEE